MKTKPATSEIEFPYEEKVGSVFVKIYKVANKTGRDGNKRESLMVFYFAKGKR